MNGSNPSSFIQKAFSGAENITLKSKIFVFFNDKNPTLAEVYRKAASDDLTANVICDWNTMSNSTVKASHSYIW
jgi:hypothetical protein